MKLEINCRKRNEKEKNYMETKQHATKKNQWPMMKSKRKFKNTLTQMTI